MLANTIELRHAPWIAGSTTSPRATVLHLANRGGRHYVPGAKDDAYSGHGPAQAKMMA